MSTNKTQNESEVSINDEDEVLALEKLLADADEIEKEAKQVENPNKETSTVSPKNVIPCLREDSTFAEAFSYDMELPTSKIQQAENQAILYREELDSSDDEGVKNFLERKYNEYGSDINKCLKEQRSEQHEQKVSREVSAAIRNSADASTSSPQTFTSNVSHIKNPHNPIQRQSLITQSFMKTPPPQAKNNTNTAAVNTNISATYSDPVFGLRIINPLISSALLVERMAGRKPVPFSSVALHIQRGDLSKDWVIAGALINKSPVRMSKNGSPFSVWSLSDLRGEIKTLSLFLFKGAHKELWKTAEGMCLAILNPTIFEKRAQSADVACLSIDTAQKVMILGQSKDRGTCRARKRNGEACTSIVNLSECDYCIFHMKQEFGKMSRRSELQSATAGRGLHELRNKVLGKSEVFYGGQSYSALPAKKSAKLSAKNNQILSSLSEYAVSPFASSINHSSKPKTAANKTVPYAARDGPISKVASNIESNRKQRLKDIEPLSILQAESFETPSVNPAEAATTAVSNTRALTTSSVTQTVASPSTSAASTPNISAASPSNSSAIADKFKNRSFSFTNTPQLSREGFSIEVNIGEQRAQLAKAKAMQILKKRPIEKVNPNSIRGSNQGKKRAIDELNEKFTTNEAKRKKIEEERREEENKSRIERIMNIASSHTNLVDMREQEAQDQYFNKLEKKEALEEKMLNTYKMPCKAVICLQCKYTAFSAAERCKEEKHALKVIDAEKRFFQCKDCGNRTVSVFKLPKISCKNCKSSRWERAAMIRERKICTGAEGLSIRGDEEIFLGSVAQNANLNLLVAEE